MTELFSTNFNKKGSKNLNQNGWINELEIKQMIGAPFSE